MISENDLLSDQVFQLNTVLWALQDTPEQSRVRAVLKRGGYYLVSIGRRLLFPVSEDVRSVFLNDLKISPTPTNPDIWLSHKDDGTYLLLELKSHGFGESSSNTEQAMKFLVSSADLKDSLGTSGEVPGAIVYLTTNDDTSSLLDTLSALSERLENLGLGVAPSGTLGLSVIAGEGVAFTSPDDSRLPAPLRMIVSEAEIVLEMVDAEDDLRPLYFIPWIPGIKESQLPELQSQGLRELTARVLTAAASVIGAATIPSTVTLTPESILGTATFGLFQNWLDSDRKKFQEECSRILRVAIFPTGYVIGNNDPLQVNIPDESAKDVITTRILNVDPSDPSRNLEVAIHRPATLFDEVEAREDA